jgi:hypothetical protein
MAYKATRWIALAQWHDPNYPRHVAEPLKFLCRLRRKEVGHMAKDPVCGVEVDEKTAAGKSEYKGQTSE